MVVLAGHKTVKEALVSNAEVFGDRDVMRIINETGKGHGFIWANGDSWREMRRFIVTNLRDFGMGKKACEDKMIEECEHLVQLFKTHEGKAFDMFKPVNAAVTNIICSMTYGHRFEYDDPEFTRMIAEMAKRTKLLGSPSMQLYNMFPWTGVFLRCKEEFLKSFHVTKRSTTAVFDRLRKSLDPQVCRGYVDAFLVRQQQESELPESYYHDDNLLMTVLNLFSAGTETMTATLRWALLFMAKYPKIQDQVQEEINHVIGSRQVQTKDRKDLPFTEAVIHESQRFGDVVPMSIPHRTSQDITFQGHFIKKGTTVYPLLTSVLYDETEWERPHSFYPAHFLDKDGKFVKKDAFMPFSAGRRICPGEGLARMELFIFFVTLMQHFRFCPPPGVTEEEVELTPINGIFHLPAPYELCAVPSM